MDAAKDDTPGMTQADKLRVQAETGEGRSMARPAGGADTAPGLQPGGATPTDAPASRGIGSFGLRGGNAVDGTSGMSGAPTNDAMPGGGATGDRPLPDTVDPEKS